MRCKHLLQIQIQNSALTLNLVSLSLQPFNGPVDLSHSWSCDETKDRKRKLYKGLATLSSSLFIWLSLLIFQDTVCGVYWIHRPTQETMHGWTNSWPLKHEQCGSASRKRWICLWVPQLFSASQRIPTSFNDYRYHVSNKK